MKYLYTFDAKGRCLSGRGVETEALALALAERLSGMQWLIVDEQHDIRQSYLDAALAIQPIPPRPSPFHTFDYTAKQWIDPRTLADLKAAKWQDIKQARDVQEATSFPYLGKQIDSDPRSVQRITTAVQAADAAPPFAIDWTCADNTTLALDGPAMQAMPVALAMYANALHQHARALRAQLDAALNADDVAAVVWAP
ncbi:hypothetical protein [Polaromonas sp. CG9_12]|nr:hypothetical protein [Polaromonas sp. CG9_12]